MARFVAASALVTAILLVIIGISGIDVSALRDFERDAVMLHAPAAGADRYFDPAPFSSCIPSDLFVWDSIRRGELPLWNRMQGGGYSALNVMQEGVLHPLRWMIAFVPRRSAPSALVVIVLATAFTGMYVLMRGSFGFSRAAALLGAIAFAFSSVFISMIHFSGGNLPLAHIPWIVFFLSRRGRAHDAGLVLSLALLFISGHPLLEAGAALAAAACALAFAAVARSLRPLLRFVFTAAAGVLIAAPAWLPAALSWPELWTYKTQTEKGTSYFAYGVGDWVEAVRATLVDVFDPQGCCIDLGGFFLYVGVAALLLAIIGARRDRTTRWFAVLTIVAFIILVPGPWMQPLRNLRPLSYFKPWYLSGGFALFVAILVAAGFEQLRRGDRVRRVIGAVLAAIVAFTYLQRAETVLRPRIVRQPLASPTLQFLHGDRDAFRVVSLWGQTHLANASRITGIEDLRLAAPILSLRYHLWWQLVDPAVMTHGYPTTRVTDRLDSPLVGDFNVKYVIESRLRPAGTFWLDRNERDRDTGLSPRLAAFSVAFRTPFVEVLRNPHPVHPRAHFATGPVVVVRSLGDALRAIASGATTVVESENAIPPSHGGTVALTYRGDPRVSMNVRSDAGGLVVLHDTFDSGWRATVDGAPADILPVNVLSRGVVVGPGAHGIEMMYRPAGFSAALGLSAAAILALALILVRKHELQIDSSDEKSHPAYFEGMDASGSRAGDAARQILETTRAFRAAANAEVVALDAGCGYAHNAVALARVCRRVVAIEPSRDLYERARAVVAESGRTNIELRHAGIEDVTDESTFDLVILDNVFEHLPDQPRALETIARALKPAGALYVLVPNKLWPVEAHYGLPFLSYLPLPVANRYLRLTRRGTDYTDASYAPTYGRLTALLRRAGFRAHFVVPEDLSLTQEGAALHYRIGAAVLKRAPGLWRFAKGFLVVATK